VITDSAYLWTLLISLYVNLWKSKFPELFIGGTTEKHKLAKAIRSSHVLSVIIFLMDHEHFYCKLPSPHPVPHIS
jgi:hypothetical protein